MTEVLFYHLQNMSLESVLPPLLEKSLERGWRVVVQSTSQERADALDAHLWTYRDDSFLPPIGKQTSRAAGGVANSGQQGLTVFFCGLASGTFISHGDAAK